MFKHSSNFGGHFGRGFTLIELMITVTIVGILTAIAIPSYSSYIVKSRRTDVQQKLIEGAQGQERFFSANGRYTLTAGTAGCGANALDATAFYTFAATCPNTNNTFSITATPVAGTSQANDGTQTLDNTGAKTNSVSTSKWIN
jgi:type IV pilus assembly protein PilE